MATRNLGNTPSAQILPFPTNAARTEPSIVAVSPEFQGYCLLYAHHALSTDKLYALRILCWARLDNSDDVALVPWLDGVARCSELNDAQTGLSQGYFDPIAEQRFDVMPAHHSAILDSLCPKQASSDNSVIQEIPDLIGSHAALLNDGHEFQLEPVVSWQLLAGGRLQAMIADPEKITQHPVLPGDPCLYPATEAEGLRYYFQYHIANQIKRGGEMTARALHSLIKH